MKKIRVLIAAILLISAILLSGCSTFSSSGGQGRELHPGHPGHEVH